MTARQDAASHHAFAALHHEQAARYHNEAATHFDDGKDCAQAAHSAHAAHRHGLQAVDHADEASKYYAKHYLGTHYVGAQNGEAPDAAARLSSADHHAAAAGHHGRAARHHDQAARHFYEKLFELAAHEARIAHRHAQYSIFHEDEAGCALSRRP